MKYGLEEKWSQTSSTIRSAEEEKFFPYVSKFRICTITQKQRHSEMKVVSYVGEITNILRWK